jgi:hypothetical protein
MTTLPGQDASLPPQQPYITGQQPMYQQVSYHSDSFGTDKSWAFWVDVVRWIPDPGGAFQFTSLLQETDLYSGLLLGGQN